MHALSLDYSDFKPRIKGVINFFLLSYHTHTLVRHTLGCEIQTITEQDWLGAFKHTHTDESVIHLIFAHKQK